MTSPRKSDQRDVNAMHVPNSSEKASILWHPATQDCTPALQSVQAHLEAEVLSDGKAAAAKLAADPALRLVVLYEGPLTALVEAMAQGTLPSEALGAWRLAARETLALIRQNRGRVLVLETGDIARHPEAACSLLELPADAFDGAFGTSEASAKDEAIFRILARNALQSDLVALDLAEELEASCQDLSNGKDRAETDYDIVFQDYRQATASAAEDTDMSWQAKLEPLEKTNKILLSQISVMQDELASLYNQRDQLQQRINQLNHGLDSYQAQIGEVEHQVAVGKDRLGEKNHQIEALAHQMRALIAQASDLRPRLEKAQAETRAKQQQIDGIMRSKSYRLMAPLRRIRAATIRRGSADV